MNILALAKLSKAIFLFIREMWLRDRTFRQFVHENLALIVSSLGFLVMAYLFTHVYFIVIDQEKIISEYEQKYVRLKEKYDNDVPFLKEQLEWYRDRYFELKAPAVNSDEQPSANKVMGPRRVQPKPSAPRPQPLSRKDADSALQDRWMRLSE